MRTLMAFAASGIFVATAGCSSETGHSPAENGASNHSVAIDHQRPPGPQTPRSGSSATDRWLVGRWGLDGDCEPEGMSIEFRPGGQFDAPGTFGPVHWRLADSGLLHLSAGSGGSEDRPAEGFASELLDARVLQVERSGADRMVLSGGARAQRYFRCTG